MLEWNLKVDCLALRALLDLSVESPLSLGELHPALPHPEVLAFTRREIGK